LNYPSLLEEQEQEQEQDVVELLNEDFEEERRYQSDRDPVATTWLISFQYIRRLDPPSAGYMLSWRA
jgi:hypothetical protein